MQQKRFKFILADEFQDINEPQYELIKLLSKPQNNLFAVGDDDQSIYGFRGASPGIMKRFIDDHPDAAKLYLTENYRCGKKIVDLAKKIISVNKERFYKDFKPQKEGGSVRSYKSDTRNKEEEMLLSMIKSIPPKSLSDCAIIVRTNNAVTHYKNLLIKHDIPVTEVTAKKKGSVFDSFISDDLIAFLSFIYEGHKRSDLIVFMNKPDRYIRKSALINETVTFTELKRYYSKNDEMIEEITSFEKKLKLAEKMSIDNAIRIFVRQLGYERYLKDIAKDEDEAGEYIKTLSKLTDLLKDRDRAYKIREYVNKCRKLEDDQNDRDKDISTGVNIITMHASKGLEFERVYLPDVNEGVIPPKECRGASLEEERRLLYVAITRAKLELNIMYTNERNRDVSRFIKNII